MTKDEIMNLVSRSLFATIGYTDEWAGRMFKKYFAYGTKDWAGMFRI